MARPIWPLPALPKRQTTSYQESDKRHIICRAMELCEFC